MIENIPAVLWGEASDKLYLFVHGKMGSKEDAALFAEEAVKKDYQVLSIDLPGHGERISQMELFVPWYVTKELQMVLEWCKANYHEISLCANSIGAWYAMLSFSEEQLNKCLFISPILDMKRLIMNMMSWAGVTLKQLEKEKTIVTEFGEKLSFEYFQYVLAHPISKWVYPTAIAYGEKDHLTEWQVLSDFEKQFECKVAIMKNGEHWFHTEEQLSFLKQWFNEQL